MTIADTLEIGTDYGNSAKPSAGKTTNTQSGQAKQNSRYWSRSAKGLGDQFRRVWQLRRLGDHFRGTEFETLFNQLRSELIVLNLSPEQAEAEFHDSLPKLERDHIDQQLNELQDKARIGAFSRADAERMNELTKRKAALHQRPDGNRSVL